jgi:hypothetical protein
MAPTPPLAILPGDTDVFENLYSIDSLAAQVDEITSHSFALIQLGSINRSLSAGFFTGHGWK